jgi:hypothetical protein
VGLWDAGWGWREKNSTFLCIGWFKKSHNWVAYKTQQSKVSTIPIMCFLETEQSTPIAAVAAADALLGLHCSAWLASLG